MKVLDRISISKLIKNHIATFYDDAFMRMHHKRRVPLADKIVFIFLPLVLSATLVCLNIFVTVDYLPIIVTSLSLFAGLLFGLLPLVYELTRNAKAHLKEMETQPQNESLNYSVAQAEVKYRIAKELFINIGFTILVAICANVTSVLTTLKSKVIGDFINDLGFSSALKLFYTAATNFINYFVIIIFVLTLFMILKRFFLLFDAEVGR